MDSVCYFRHISCANCRELLGIQQEFILSGFSVFNPAEFVECPNGCPKECNICTGITRTLIPDGPKETVEKLITELKFRLGVYREALTDNLLAVYCIAKEYTVLDKARNVKTELSPEATAIVTLYGIKVLPNFREINKANGLKRYTSD